MSTYIQNIWDLPIRIFHWLLVMAIIFSYVTSQMSGEWLYWHIEVGVFIFSLMVFRIAWGFVGTPTSQFKTFFPTPSRFRDVYKRKIDIIGHSPLGALSIFALTLLIFFQVLTGIFSINDEIDISGPMYSLVNSGTSDNLTRLHSKLFDFLSAMIAFHIIAIVYHFVFKKNDLVSPMVTGRKKFEINHRYSPSLNKISVLFSFSLALLAYWIIDSGILLSSLLYIVK